MKEKRATGPDSGLSFASRVCLHIQEEQNSVPLMLWACPYYLPDLAWSVKPVLFKEQLHSGVKITSLPPLGVGCCVFCYLIVSKEHSCDSSNTKGIHHKYSLWSRKKKRATHTKSSSISWRFYYSRVIIISCSYLFDGKCSSKNIFWFRDLVF